MLNQGVATFSGLSYDVAETMNILFVSSAGSFTATSSGIVVSPNSAANQLQLVITQQPSSSATAGVNFTSQPVVKEEDAFGNVITSDSSSTVTAARGTQGTGALQGGSNLTVMLDQGVATFSGLSYNVAETMNITFTTTAGSFSATSNNSVVSPNTASKQLVVTTQPSSTASAGVAFGTQPVVKEEDAFGNVFTTDSTSTVTAVRGTAGTATLQGASPTVTLNQGVATFSGLFYDKAETMNITFSTSAGSFTTNSSSVVVNPNTAANQLQLVITQQPSTTATAGITFGTQPVVKEEDAFGNVLTGDNSTIVTAARGTMGTGALQGTNLAVTLNQGVAAFSGLFYDRAETINITFSTSGLSATSGSIAVSPNAVNQLVFGQQPTTTGAGVAINPAVTVMIEDQFGNLVTTDNADQVTIGIAGGPGSFTVGSTLIMTASGGVATFGNLVLDTAGSYTLSESATSDLGGPASNSFTVTPQSPTQLLFGQQPGSTVAGVAINPAVTAKLEDQYGNIVTTDNTDQVTVGVASGPGTLSGSSTLMATVSAGVATFGNLILDTAGSYTLSESATGGLIGLNSSSFTVTVAAAQHLAFLQEPTNSVAGQSISPAMTVEVLDQFNNLISTDTSFINLAIGTGPGGAALSGITSVAAIDGIATFSNLSINKSATGYVLTATDGNLVSANSSTFAISAASADHLAFSVMPTNTVASHSLNPAVKVQVLDQFGNLVTTDTSNVTVAIGNNPGSGSLSGTTSEAAVGGVATFGNLSIDAAGTGYALSAADGSLTGALSSSFNITALTPDHLVFTQQPTNTVAGQTISPAVTVDVVDVFGNLVTTDNSNVVVSIGSNPGSSTLNGTLTVTAIGGVATFSNLSINNQATGYTLAVTDGSLIGAASNAFVISSSPTTHLAFSVEPASAVAGQSIGTVTVQLLDASGNLDGDDTSSVTLAIGTNAGGGTLGGAITAQASDGVATFNNVFINKAGSGYTLTASDGSLITGAVSSSFNISAASASQLAFVVQPSNTIAGQSITQAVQVDVEDQFGNLVTTDTSNVSVAIGTNPGGGTLSGTASAVAAVGGIASFGNLSINKSGTSYTLTAVDASLSSATSSAFNITAAAPDHLVFAAQPTSTLAGAAINPAVQVLVVDQFGNQVTTDTSNVTLAMGNNPGSSTLNGTLTQSASGGVATFSGLTIDTSAMGYSLTAADGSLTGAASATFNISPAAANHLAFSVQPTSTVAGQSISAVTVRVLDQFNNLVSTDSSNISLALGTNPGGDVLGGTTTEAASGGVATFSNLVLIKAAIGYTLAATDGSLSGVASSSFNITPASASKLVFGVAPTNTVAGQAISPSVQVFIEDQFGNVLTTDSTDQVTVAVASGPGAFSGSSVATVTAGAGVATFTNLHLNTAGSYALSESATSGLTGPLSSSFIVSPNTAANQLQLVITQQPSTAVMAGVNFATQPVVVEEDAFGNVVTSDSSSTVMAATGTQGTGSLQGANLTVTLNQGVATFSGLSYDKAETMNITFSTSAGSFTAISNNIVVNPNAASERLVITTQPSSTAAAGSIFAIQPIVKEEDAFGNVFTSDSSTRSARPPARWAPAVCKAPTSR